MDAGGEEARQQCAGMPGPGAAQEQRQPHQVEGEVSRHRKGGGAGQHDLRGGSVAGQHDRLGRAVVRPEPHGDPPQRQAADPDQQRRDQRQRHHVREVTAQRRVDRQVARHPPLAVADREQEQVVQGAVVRLEGRMQGPEQTAAAENTRVEHRHVLVAGQVVIEQDPGAHQPDRGHQQRRYGHDGSRAQRDLAGGRNQSGRGGHDQQQHADRGADRYVLLLRAEQRQEHQAVGIPGARRNQQRRPATRGEQHDGGEQRHPPGPGSGGRAHLCVRLRRCRPRSVRHACSPPVLAPQKQRRAGSASAAIGRGRAGPLRPRATPGTGRDKRRSICTRPAIASGTTRSDGQEQ